MLRKVEKYNKIDNVTTRKALLQNRITAHIRLIKRF